MTTNQVGELYSDPGTGFGFGFAVITDLSRIKALGSEGQFFWSGANQTFFFVDPKEELVAMVMSQITPYSNYYGDKMRQFVYQAIVD
jgi:CubicO group peptidase (beta-lactamase class C family)